MKRAEFIMFRDGKTQLHKKQSHEGLKLNLNLQESRGTHEQLSSNSYYLFQLKVVELYFKKNTINIYFFGL